MKTKAKQSLASYGTVLVELIIKNAYHFKGRHVVPLERSGLTNVIGRNLDTSEESSNGSGKSQISHCLQRIAYGTKATKYETVAESINGKGFLLGLKTRRNGNIYEIYEARKDDDFPKDGLYCFMTGPDGKRVPFGMKNSGEKLREEFAQAAIGMSYDEFVGSTVINQGSTHVLLKGSPQERVEFISKLFGLGVYDELYAKFKQSLKDVESQIEEYRGYGVEQSTLLTSLSTLGNIDEAKLLLEKTQTKLDASRSARKRLRSEKTAYETASGERRLYEKITKSIAELKATSRLDFDNYEHEMKRLLGKQSELEKTIAQVESSSEVNEKLALLRRQRKSLRGGIPEKYLTKSAKQLQGSIDKLSAKDSTETACLRDLASKRNIVETIKVNMQQLEQVGLLDVDYDEAKRLYEEHSEMEKESQAEIDKIIARLEIKEGIDTSLTCCPTCGAKVDVKCVEKEIKALNSEMVDFERQRKSHHKIAQKHRLFCDTQDLIEKNKIDLNVTEGTLEELADKIQGYRDQRQRLRVIYEKLIDLEKIEAQIKSLRTSETYSQEDLDTLKKKKKKVQASLDMLRQYVSLMKSIPEKKPGKVNLDIEDLEARLRSVDDKIESRGRRIERLQATINDAFALKKRIDNLEEKLEKLRKLERDQRVFKGLCLAYGKNGLKTKKIREIIEAIKERLPTWVALMFTQRGFRIDTYGNENKLGFTVVQGFRDEKGKLNERSYDIRRLSGGEHTRVMIALIMTLIDIIPENKRSNLLFLDELESGLDPVNRSLIAELLIPMLRKRKPSLFVISHSLNMPRAIFDTEVVVTRENSQGSIKVTNLRKGNQ